MDVLIVFTPDIHKDFVVINARMRPYGRLTLKYALVCDSYLDFDAVAIQMVVPVCG